MLPSDWRGRSRAQPHDAKTEDAIATLALSRHHGCRQDDKRTRDRKAIYPDIEGCIPLDEKLEIPVELGLADAHEPIEQPVHGLVGIEGLAALEHVEEDAEIIEMVGEPKGR